MRLAAALAATSKHSGPICGVRSVLERLATTDPELAAEIIAALANPTTIAAELSRATFYLAREDGATITGISQNVITYHLRGDCGCTK